MRILALFLERYSNYHSPVYHSITCDVQHLAEPHTHFGKAAIMTAANHGKAVSFNKYSGVAEWKNALFLWVNIGTHCVFSELLLRDSIQVEYQNIQIPSSMEAST